MLDGFVISNLPTKQNDQQKQMHLYRSLYINTVHTVKVHEHHFFQNIKTCVYRCFINA